MLYNDRVRDEVLDNTVNLWYKVSDNDHLLKLTYKEWGSSLWLNI